MALFAKLGITQPGAAASPKRGTTVQAARRSGW